MASKLPSANTLQCDRWLPCCTHVPYTQGNQLEEGCSTGQPCWFVTGGVCMWLCFLPSHARRLCSIQGWCLALDSFSTSSSGANIPQELWVFIYHSILWSTKGHVMYRDFLYQKLCASLSFPLCQVPFTTMMALLCLWFGISFPLVFGGFYFGFRKQPYEHPVRTNQIPRQVPEQVWYLHPVLAWVLDNYFPNFV